jgi:hypothetical protein
MLAFSLSRTLFWQFDLILTLSDIAHPASPQLFLLGSLLLSLAALALSGFRLTRAYAAALVLLYAGFLVVSLLLQLGVIADPKAPWL